MDIKFFVPYVEAKKRLDIRASIVGRWLEAGSYEDRRGDGVWRRVRTSRMNRDFSVWLLDFKSRGRLVRTEVAPGRRRYGIVPDIDPGEIPAPLCGTTPRIIYFNRRKRSTVGYSSSYWS